MMGWRNHACNGRTRARKQSLWSTSLVRAYYNTHILLV